MKMALTSVLLVSLSIPAFATECNNSKDMESLQRRHDAFVDLKEKSAISLKTQYKMLDYLNSQVGRKPVTSASSKEEMAAFSIDIETRRALEKENNQVTDDAQLSLQHVDTVSKITRMTCPKNEDRSRSEYKRDKKVLDEIEYNNNEYMAKFQEYKIRASNSARK
ncbi:hypothetical protein [Pseudomonas sp. A-B-26]|uniref:hypothetical protein n=1 Tax=Pseudomonas sp. A-B-26 TaxID=2832406 RepID=UPI001CBC0B9D|nr:hypothetical protein [Pseudomonas sp. A-B-26]